MADRDDDNGAEFERYKLLFLRWFERIDHRLEQIEKRLSIIEVEIVTVKIKAGLWGALAGATPGAVAAILWLIKNS